MSKGGRSIFAVLVLAGVFALAGCGGDDTSSGGGGLLASGGGGGSGGPGGPPPAATTPPPTLGAGCGQQGTDLICITLSSGAAGLPADGTSTSVITATLTRNGAAATGQIVDFTLSNATLGTLTAASGVTAANGAASTTFQAGGTIGAAGITATHAASSAANTIALALTQPPAATPGGIQFISATPSAVGVVGSGQSTTANVVFRVTSASGTATPGATVNFTMTGPAGSYIGTQDGTPTTASGTTDNAGNVTIPLNAGTAAGPVTITANVTVAGITFTTSTSVISIGGAVPSAKWFSIATTRFNLPGFSRFGVEATLRVFLADRFSNFNILEGTQVSFFTEAGAVDTSVNLDETGFGEVTIRTQNPMPATITVPHLFLPNANGWLRVIAVARGEEAFGDLNGNGLYDPGIDSFTTTMDQDEPYIDTNENGVWDGPGCTQAGCDSANPGEFFTDANGNGVFNPKNGIWDGPGCTQAGCNPNPLIWTSIILVFTGDLICTLDTPNNFTVANGAVNTYNVTVGDARGNRPVPGTTVNISVTGGIGVGTGAFTVPDGFPAPTFTRSFGVGDNDTSATSTAVIAGVTVTVTVPNGEVATCDPIVRSGVVN